jgi:ATP-dependent RNA helicase RhlE
VSLTVRAAAETPVSPGREGSPVSAFAALGLSPGMSRAAAEQGWSEPTPIQAAAIPPALAGRDLLATAATGSGKTGAYALAALQRIDGMARPSPRRPRVLVLLPTRELVAQVAKAMRPLERFLNVPAKLTVLYGGVSINPQLMALRGGVDVVVATPGRLLDVADKNALDLSGLHTLVLDEADRLLDAGFADELARVLALLPDRRLNLLFSATFPPPVQALAQRLLHDPVRVDVGHQAASVAAIAERAIVVDAARRTPLLARLIGQEGWERVLVFVATRYACDHVASKLSRAGLAAAAFQGDASQGARTQVLADFKAGKLQVLVATDLGARGIDIARLPVVVNYDLPRSTVDYVHRIGRTARAGEAGLAVSFLSAATEAQFRLIEKRQARRVPREHVPGFEPTEVAAPAPAAGGVKGRRPSKKDKLRAGG